MSARVFVGNLKFTVSDEALKNAFAQLGRVVRAEIVRDKYDGRSRGFAFVEIAGEGDVTTVVRELSGKPLAGRPMRVEAAIKERPQPRRSRAARRNKLKRARVLNCAAEIRRFEAHG